MGELVPNHQTNLSRQEVQYLKALYFQDRARFMFAIRQLEQAKSLHLLWIELGADVADRVYQELMSGNPLRRASAKWAYMNWQQLSARIVNTYP